jgi:ABC-type uncharacterized transport system permease subunit
MFMADPSELWLRVAAILYFIAALHAAFSVLLRWSPQLGVIVRLFAVGVLLHMVSLVESALRVGRVPLESFPDSLSLFAFLVAVAFLYAYWRYRFESLSVAIFPLACAMMVLPAVRGTAGVSTRDGWLVVHVLLVLGGYAALLFTGVAAVFYLIQERQLKRKRPFMFFEHLPPLAVLDRIIVLSMAAGFLLISLGLAAGTVWAYTTGRESLFLDPKVVVSYVTWSVCLLMLFLRVSAGWRGRRTAMLALAALGLSAVTWAAHVGLRTWLQQ